MGRAQQGVRTDLRDIRRDCRAEAAASVGHAVGRFAVIAVRRDQPYLYRGVR